jgi:hypothetical protein
VKESMETIAGTDGWAHELERRRMSDCGAAAGSGAVLGEHTDEILAHVLKMQPDEILRLRSKKIV